MDQQNYIVYGPGAAKIASLGAARNMYVMFDIAISLLSIDKSYSVCRKTLLHETGLAGVRVWCHGSKLKMEASWKYYALRRPKFCTLVGQEPVLDLRLLYCFR